MVMMLEVSTDRTPSTLTWRKNDAIDTDSPVAQL